MKIYYENHDFKLTVFEVSNFTFPFAHWHTKVEIAFVLEGSILIGVNNEKKLLHKGDSVVIGSGDIHYYDGQNLNCRMLILIFNSEFINAPSGWPESKRFSSNYIPKELIESTELNKLLPLAGLIKDEFEKKDYTNEFFLKSYLYNICGLLLRYFPTIDLNDKVKYNVSPKLKMLQEIFTYIEANYMNDINVISISKLFNISPKYFSKLFNSMSIINFKTHLNTIRISKAENLILQGNYTLTKIAFECGFNSIRTFNRVYKTLRGFVPSSLKSD
ncbi:MAG: helix-turn-helix transcriptional regulator [Clostridiaceae bacterium]|nr:helix-turn-helix transcriptional regulator [Clostridiaceae bacterium]